MKVIGVTGGIAAGKSTIAAHVADCGGELFDADLCVHQLMTHNKSLIKEIDGHYPDTVSEGVVNRAVLGEIVFGDLKKLEFLEKLLHPYVREQESEFLENAVLSKELFVVMDIPLLFETDAHKFCDIIFVADCTEETQRDRAMQRPAMTKEKLDGIIKRQMPRSERNDRANYVISTELPEEQVKEQIKLIMEEEGLCAK